MKLFSIESEIYKFSSISFGFEIGTRHILISFLYWSIDTRLNLK